MKNFAAFFLKNIIILAFFAPFSGCFSSRKISNPEISSLSANLPTELQAAKTKLEQNKPKKALKLLEKWIENNQDSKVMDQGLFLKAQALFNRKLYYQSYLVYEELLDQHGSSELFAPTLRQEVEIARRFLSGAKRRVWKIFYFSARTEGLTILERVADRWPGSELAAQALMMQANHQFSHKRYLEAQQTYEMLVKNYKFSSHYREALLKNAQVTHALYRGCRYDTVCLHDAIIRYQAYRSAFPQEATEDKIDAIIENIKLDQAEKEHEIADFYDRTGEKEAAQFYWNYISRRWPDSKWANLAQSNLNKFQEKEQTKP